MHLRHPRYSFAYPAFLPEPKNHSSRSHTPVSFLPVRLSYRLPHLLYHPLQKIFSQIQRLRTAPFLQNPYALYQAPRSIIRSHTADTDCQYRIPACSFQNCPFLLRPAAPFPSRSGDRSGSAPASHPRSFPAMSVFLSVRSSPEVRDTAANIPPVPAAPVSPALPRPDPLH